MNKSKLQTTLLDPKKQPFPDSIMARAKGVDLFPYATPCVEVYVNSGNGTERVLLLQVTVDSPIEGESRADWPFLIEKIDGRRYWWHEIFPTEKAALAALKQKRENPATKEEDGNQS